MLVTVKEETPIMQSEVKTQLPTAVVGQRRSKRNRSNSNSSSDGAHDGNTRSPKKKRVEEVKEEIFTPPEQPPAKPRNEDIVVASQVLFRLFSSRERAREIEYCWVFQDSKEMDDDYDEPLFTFKRSANKRKKSDMSDDEMSGSSLPSNKRHAPSASPRRRTPPPKSPSKSPVRSSQRSPVRSSPRKLARGRELSPVPAEIETPAPARGGQ